MAKIAVFNMAGQQVSETELSDAVFAVTPNEAVMHAISCKSAPGHTVHSDPY